jgi:hypothetical protein
MIDQQSRSFSSSSSSSYNHNHHRPDAPCSLTGLPFFFLLSFSFFSPASLLLFFFLSSRHPHLSEK